MKVNCLQCNHAFALNEDQMARARGEAEYRGIEADWAWPSEPSHAGNGERPARVTREAAAELSADELAHYALPHGLRVDPDMLDDAGRARAIELLDARGAFADSTPPTG